MGLANHSLAVLDSKARVHGVQELRVVHDSAFPVFAARTCLVYHTFGSENVPTALEF